MDSLIGLLPSYDTPAVHKLLDDDTTRFLTLRALASQVLDQPQKLLCSADLLDFLGTLCLSARFAESEGECWFVAVLLSKCLKDVDPRPWITVHRGLQLSAKVMTCLAVYPEALEARERRGAPSASFYRSASKCELIRYHEPAVAAHHELWEEHLTGLIN